MLLNSCIAGSSAIVADFNGDGINDIGVTEATDCNGEGSCTFNVLLGKGNGAFQPEQVVNQSGEFINPLDVLRASGDTKADVVLTGEQFNGNEFISPFQLLMLNTAPGHSSECNPVNLGLSRITFYAPTSTTGANSPVNFSFAAENHSAGRDFEIWVDGAKVADQLTHSFSYYTFADASVQLAGGQHKVDMYSKAWDGWEQFATFPLTVGSDTCPQLPADEDGINICSPIRYSSVSSPVLAYAHGKISDGSIVRMEVWVDRAKRYTTFSSDTLNTYLTITPGTHTLTYYLVNTNGGIDSSSTVMTVR